MLNPKTIRAAIAALEGLLPLETDGPRDTMSAGTPAFDTEDQPMWQKHWALFILTMADRLERGHKAYGDLSFIRIPAELDDEIDEEIMDVIGWAFIRWVQRQERKQNQT